MTSEHPPRGLHLALVCAAVTIAAQLAVLFVLPELLPSDGLAADALDRVTSTAYGPFLDGVAWFTPSADHTIGNLWLAIFALSIGVLAYSLVAGAVGYALSRCRSFAVRREGAPGSDAFRR
ncbi:MAG: hypothetical protein U0625_02495 [Phycisphaerales bacterium]